MAAKEKLLILDGNSLLNRAFYALPPLTNMEGVHTNAVYGFTTMLYKMKEEIEPDYIVCTFDRSAPTFRHKEYKEYKAGRKRMPPELAEQFPIVKDLLNKFAISIFEIDGFEADDLIGTLSNIAEQKDIEAFIVTGDKDALQLASDTTKVILTKKGITEKEVYDKNRMIEEMGVTPTEFIDVKGLMGDSSDNIPGVPGIGEKTAFKLIKEYKTVENVLQNIDNIRGKKLKENLVLYREQAIFSKKLATIIREVPIEIDLDEIKSKENYDIDGVKKLFMELQFKSLLEKADSLDDREEEKFEIEYNTVYNIKQLQNFLDLLEESKSEEIYMTFKLKDENVYSKSFIEKIFVNYDDSIYVLDLEKLIDENKEETINKLKDIFGNEKLLKVCHDVKIPYTILCKMGISLKKLVFDTKIASYVIDPSRKDYGVGTLIQQFLRKFVKEDDPQKDIKEIYFLKDLYKVLKNNIEDHNMNKLYYEVELPLIKVLSNMEAEGFMVDKQTLMGLGEKFQKEIQKTQSYIFLLSGEEFNVNSPKQLGKILFEKLDLPVIKKTKTGYSTNASVLEALEDKHPIIEKIMYYRQLTKLYSTYVEGLKNVIDVDGKIHTNFNQTVTTTGRLSSTDPNLQNIPIKYDMGREIRKVFVPNNDKCKIISADYSQIELRVLAHIADDENLINAFKHHIDIHTKTASEVFKVDIKDVTHTMRSNAKAVNFGIVYGIGDFSLAKDLKISRKEAKNYIDTYFERYPNVKKYMNETIEKAKKNMYVTTILNRRRFIPEILDSKKMVRASGERLAMNSPIQGSAADIIKMAMVKVFNRLQKENLKSTLILQVHDELILNVYDDELSKIEDILKDSMEKVIELKVPLEVDMNVGDTWYDVK